MKSRIVIAVVCIELLVIIGIIVFLFLPKGLLLQINPLTDFSIQPSKDTQFQYYYEFPSNTIDYGKAPWLPYTATYRYNKDGLNERFDYELKKAPNIYRIVMLGDSFTFGMWVNTEDNFSEKLEDKLNTSLRCEGISKFEVINLGAPGFDVKYTAKRYDDKGAAYTPDFVIWFMRGENIFMDVEQYRKREEFYKQELQSTGAAERYHVDKADQYAASTLSYAEYMDTYNKLPKEQQELFIQPSINAITQWAKQYRVPFLIATLASEEDRYKAIMKSFTKLLDHSWYYEIGPIDTFSPYDYHPNIQGHEKIASELYDYIFSHVLTSCTVYNF